MRRARRLTSGERWELGVFLGILVAGCIGLAELAGHGGISNLMGLAFESRSDAAQVPSAVVQTPTGHPSPASFMPPAAPFTVVPPALGPSRAATLRPALVPMALRPDSLPGGFGRGASVVRKPAEEIRWYKGEKYRYAKTLRLRVTAYAPDARCCWPYPGTTTASGLSVKTNHGKLVAADTRVIPLHALVSVPGYGGGAPVPVLDRGGAIKGNRLDVLLPTFDQAKEWGTRVVEVKVWMPVGG